MSPGEDLLSALRPMFVSVDAAGRIAALGPTLEKVLGRVAGRPFFEVLEVVRPRDVQDATGLCASAGRRLHITARAAPETGLVGLAVPDGAGGVVLDLGFGIGVAEAVRRHGLTGSDFSPTDLTMEILFLIEAQRAAMTASRRLNNRLHAARQTAEAEAATDMLTGLANRRAADLALAALGEGDAAFGLVHLDLDRFKQVNDRFGHHAGDMVLKDVALALKGAIRPEDLAARNGGDEFLMIFPGLSDLARLEGLCARLIARIERPHAHGAARFAISASAGIAVWPGGPGSDPGALLARADAALYAAKRSGRGRAASAPAPTGASGAESGKSGRKFLPEGLDPPGRKP
ncbi:GGDEF domain-containing protein [Roseivivax sp.]